MSIPCNLRDDVVDVAGSSGRLGMHTHGAGLWAQAVHFPGEAEEHSNLFVVCAPHCNLTAGEEQHITEFSMTFGFLKFDLCSENRLSQVPFHTTCLVYLVQLIAVENVYSHGQVFVVRY